MNRDSSPFITMRHHPSHEHTQPFITAELHSPTVTTTTANACCNCLPPQRRTRQLQRRVAPTATGAEHLALEKTNVKRLISLLLLVSIPGILLCSGLQLSNHKRIKLNLTSIKREKKISRAPLSPGWSITLIASPPPAPKSAYCHVNNTTCNGCSGWNQACNNRFATIIGGHQARPGRRPNSAGSLTCVHTRARPHAHVSTCVHYSGAHITHGGH